MKGKFFASSFLFVGWEGRKGGGKGGERIEDGNFLGIGKDSMDGWMREGVIWVFS